MTNSKYTNAATRTTYKTGNPSCRAKSKEIVTFSRRKICAGILSVCAGLTLLQVHAQSVGPTRSGAMPVPVTGGAAAMRPSAAPAGRPPSDAAPISAAKSSDGPADRVMPYTSEPQRNTLASDPLRNGFAPELKPTVRRVQASKRPYAPIAAQNDQGQIPEIEMFVGESRVFPTPGVARIAVGNGQIMSAAALDEKEVIVFANGVGTSSLFVWNADGRYQRVKVSIVPGDTSRIAREVAAFLKTMLNARTSIVGDKVIVEGDNLSDGDLAKVEQLEKRYPQIINFTNRLGWEPMVMLDVKVVEFPVNELREIGLKWGSVGGAAIGAIWSPGRRGTDGPYQINIQSAQSAPAPITNPGGAGAAAGVVLPSGLNVLSALNLGLNAQLNLLAQEGKASLLAQPQLSARSGTKASFLAGGEFPYTVATNNGVTVQFKPYGIKLDILPKVDRNGVVRATIETEVSKIDASISSLAGPALQTRKTNTEFNVRAGETIVLAGMLQVDNSTSIDKVPLLGDIPILGALFRSKRFENKETELVVFVTPTVVDSRTPALMDRVERATGQLQNNLGKSPYLEIPASLGPQSQYVMPATENRSAQTPAPVSPVLCEREPCLPFPRSGSATLQRNATSVTGINLVTEQASSTQPSTTPSGVSRD
ncbi:type II and III secretion system protein family protein [Actimicrobium antarcticum]|uniref:Type IV pilus biogenesis and competence protein PilQ n=1 Tax=Actimicrobium antarcticum TaxID=1051899 RepID=A0ABP7SPQ9_9BURK